MTAKTPVYQLEYIVEGEPLREARLALENNAKSIEAALVLGGIAPPAAQDLATLSGRVTALEADTNPTEVTYAQNWAAYNDVPAGWTGLRYWRNGFVVTVSGAVRTTAAVANLALVATLPTGYRPASTYQSTSPLFTIRSNGQIQLVASQSGQPINFVAAFSATYGVL